MHSTTPYDAILLVSFGGPEARDDVMPFLENVTRGRGVPRDRLLEVAEHYYHFDGVSPINAQNRALLTALRALLDVRGPALPLYWGNRNWRPFLTDTVARWPSSPRPSPHTLPAGNIWTTSRAPEPRWAPVLP